VARARIQARRTHESKSNFKYSSQNEKKPGGRTATGHIHSQKFASDQSAATNTLPNTPASANAAIRASS
jgi:hypothetical protein